MISLCNFNRSISAFQLRRVKHKKVRGMWHKHLPITLEHESSSAVVSASESTFLPEKLKKKKIMKMTFVCNIGSHLYFSLTKKKKPLVFPTFRGRASDESWIFMYSGSPPSSSMALGKKEKAANNYSENYLNFFLTQTAQS